MPRGDERRCHNLAPTRQSSSTGACDVAACTKTAQGQRTRCAGHGGGRRCDVAECTKTAQGRSTRCVGHGGGRRCPNCVLWPDARSGSDAYDGWCATCFKRVFPEDPRSAHVYTHTKEAAVRNMINDKNNKCYLLFL